jgi:tRNA(Ile)-lysidine synthase
MINNLYQRFNDNINNQDLMLNADSFAIAVSGGSDSIALLLLAKKFANKNNKNIIALTVDHKLRENSGIENIKVQELCKSLGIIHKSFFWDSNSIESGIEAKAREARYELMTQFCVINNIKCLLVGHTLDDRIENFFIRLSRGSGIHGLSSNNIMYFNNIAILRPLSNIAKQELIDFLSIEKIDFSTDESNLNPKYSQRNEIRYKLESFLDSNFIDKVQYKKRIITSLNLLDQAYEIIKTQFNDFLSKKVIISSYGFAVIKHADISTINHHILFYILSHLLTIIGGNLFTPKAYKIDNLIKIITLGVPNHTTLHNCCVLIRDNQIIIYKEQNRTKYFCTMEKKILVDKRFLMEIEGKIDNSYVVTNFTSEDFYKIKKDFNFQYFIAKDLIGIKNILFTLPVLKTLENKLIIPHINYGTSEVEFSIKISFLPQYISKFTF